MHEVYRPDVLFDCALPSSKHRDSNRLTRCAGDLEGRASEIRDATLLQCCALQLFAVASRSTGSLFESTARLLPSLLAPLLDKLSDPDSQARASHSQDGIFPPALILRAGVNRSRDRTVLRLALRRPRRHAASAHFGSQRLRG